MLSEGGNLNDQEFIQTFHVLHTVKACNWEKIENRFSIFEFRLGINFSLFRFRHFGDVESRLGLPVAGVEIDTG